MYWHMTLVKDKLFTFVMYDYSINHTCNIGTFSDTDIY
jgi:hypothetical protein